MSNFEESGIFREQSKNINLNLCAGVVLSPEASKTLRDLVVYLDPYPNFLDSIKLEESAFRRLQIDCSKVTNIWSEESFYSCNTKQEVIDKLSARTNETIEFAYDAYLKYQEAITVNPRLADDIEESFGMPFSRILQMFLYKMSFCSTELDKVYHTDIGGVVSALQPKEEKVIFDSLEDYLSPKREEEGEWGDESTEKTTLSPLVLRVIANKLSRLRDAYVEDIQARHIITVEDMIEGFKENEALNYKDAVVVKQEGQNILLSWANPQGFSRFIAEGKSELCEMIQPIKDLLFKLGGDLSCEVDGKITMIINCPEFEPTEYSEDILAPDSRVFALTRTYASIYSGAANGLIRVSRGKEYEPLILEMNDGFFNGEITGEGFSNLFSNIDALDPRHSLTRLWIDSCSNGATSLSLLYDNNQTYGIESTFGESTSLSINELNDNIDSNVCAGLAALSELSDHSLFYFSEATSSEFSKHLDAMYRIVQQTEELSDNFAEYHLRKITDVDDSRFKYLDFIGYYGFNAEDGCGDTVVKALYIDNGFYGRFHSPSLTKDVLHAYDRIVERDLRSSNPSIDELISVLYEKLGDSGIVPTENFKSFIRDAFQWEKKPYIFIRDYIETGLVTLKKEDGTILLDCPENLDGVSVKEFLLAHPVE